ncbi:MAG: DNA ligase D [Thermoanaerobaculia bacterium]
MAQNQVPARTRGGSPGSLLDRLFPPMFATLATSLPASEAEWILELKYDGFRALAAGSSGDLALRSRNGLDLAARFPEVAAACTRIKAASFVVDGEIVALDDEGAPRFQLLQRGGGEIYVVFDLLWLDGKDLRGLPIEERRAMLEKLLRRAPRGIRLSEIVDAPAHPALEDAARRGYEGLIAKQRRSKYEGRRSKAWLKLKAVNMQEFAIVGFTPATNSDAEIGALLLGVAEPDGGYAFAGKVGTGFSAALRSSFVRDLARDRVAKPVVRGAPRMRDAIWVEPRLVAQVRFTEWTADGRLRHPSLLGLRPDKAPHETQCEQPVRAAGKSTQETPRAKAHSKRASKAANPPAASKKPRRFAEAPAVVLTNPDRVMYPKDGFTKHDVADYFAAVAEPMIRALTDRPLALEHWNQGIAKPSWFQQNVGREGAPWITYIDTPTRTSNKSVRHLTVDRPETLQWLAQYSVLTMHMWSSRGASLENPDWVVIDLDPAKGKGIEQAIDTALVLRRLFDELQIPSVPKTSGKRGIHIFIPLAPGYTHEEAGDFACRIADSVASKLSWATTERAIAKRRGRLYLDCMQNGYGKTIVAPYSLRAIDGAPVSAPLEWSEVTKKLDPLAFNLRTMPERLAKKGDLFARALEGGVKLPRLRQEHELSS